MNNRIIENIDLYQSVKNTKNLNENDNKNRDAMIINITEENLPCEKIRMNINLDSYTLTSIIKQEEIKNKYEQQQAKEAIQIF